MQFRKPLAPRCTVDGRALELMQKIAIIKCNRIADAAKSRRKIYGDDRVLLNKLMPLARGEQHAIDQLHADLCGLPFEQITVVDNPKSLNGEKFLHGVTRTIIVDEIERGDKIIKGKYDIGEYDTYLFQHIFVGSPIANGMHFVPRRDPETYARHWHHTCGRGRDDRPPYHFNDGYPSTCMNTYGAIFQDLARNLAFAEFFRIVHNFLSHYYSGSPLSHPNNTVVRQLK
jgi:hypothetical protein